MNYGDKHTEDSLSSRLGRLYGKTDTRDATKPTFCT